MPSAEPTSASQRSLTSWARRLEQAPTVEIGVVAINEFGGGEPQHRITKELQPFQVAGPAARYVGEGLIHQGE